MPSIPSLQPLDYLLGETIGLRLEPMYPRAGKLFRKKGGQLLEGAEPNFLSSNEVHHLLTGDIPWNAQVSRYRQAIRLLKTTDASTVDSG